MIIGKFYNHCDGVGTILDGHLQSGKIGSLLWTRHTA